MALLRSLLLTAPVAQIYSYGLLSTAMPSPQQDTQCREECTRRICTILRRNKRRKIFFGGSTCSIPMRPSGPPRKIRRKDAREIRRVNWLAFAPPNHTELWTRSPRRRPIPYPCTYASTVLHTFSKLAEIIVDSICQPLTHRCPTQPSTVRRTEEAPDPTTTRLPTVAMYDMVQRHIHLVVVIFCMRMRIVRVREA